MKSIGSDNKLNGKFIHLLNYLWRQDFGQLYLWHLVWFLSVWIFFMVDPANPLRWCWWWRWHGWRGWGWCKGRNGQTSWTFFLSTPFFVDKLLSGKFTIHWTFSFYGWSSSLTATCWTWKLCLGTFVLWCPYNAGATERFVRHSKITILGF